MGISIQSTSSTSVTLFLTGLDTSWTNGTRTACWYLGSANGGTPTESAYYKTKTASISDGVSSGGQVTFTGLSPNTRYGVYCAVYHGSEFLKSWQGFVSTDYEGGGGDEGGGEGTETSVEPWSWYTSNGSASNSQTWAANEATISLTSVKNFSYLVWNDMVDKVKEILDATGNTWDTYYDTMANTKMTSSDKTLTAKRFNSLRYNIGSHYSTGIEEVEKGNVVYGWYFQRLVGRMNLWIDKFQGSD